MPVVLHSPTRPNAVPTSPAIRLHPSTAGEPSGNPTRPRGARFADDANDGQDDKDHQGGRATNNVTFQTRPRGYTGDSTNSEGSPAYPTFAAYRQAQHGNLEAFAQRIKRAFATSQQQQLEQQQREHEAQLAAMAAAGGGNTGIHMQSLSPGSAHNVGVQFDQNGSTRSLVGSPQQQPTTRSRSASAASIIGDFAERIKNGTLFSRSQTSIIPTRSAADPQAQQPQTRSRSGTGLSVSGADLGGGAGSGGSFTTTPAIEVMLASDSDEQLQQEQRIPSLQDSSVQQGDASYQQTESKRTDQTPRGVHEEGERPPVFLDSTVPTTYEEKVESEKDSQPLTRQVPKRQDSEDTVVVTMDGIRRPSVNGGQQRTSN